METVVRRIQAAFEVDPWVNPHRDQIKIREERGRVVLEGEVRALSAKRRAPLVAREVEGVEEVVDRLTVTPTEEMEDDEILEHLGRILLDDIAFKHYRIDLINHKGEEERLQDPPQPAGWLRIHAEDGTVWLEGEVKSLCDFRLLEAYAWWIPGIRNVVNRLKVNPPEEDSDEQLKEAIRLILDTDRFANGEMIAFDAQDGKVRLWGAVRYLDQKKLIEDAIWAIPGVREIQNGLTVP